MSTAPPPRLFASGRRYARLAHLIGIDLRALATFRILLGLLLAVNLAARFADFRFFYADDGLVTAQEAWEGRFRTIVSGCTLFQPTALLGSQLGGRLLFAAGALASGMLITGWRTFWATLLAYLTLVGLDARNPILLNSGDDLFRALLFWSLFLPLGARWSLDARRPGHPWGRRRSNAFLSVATFALLVQLAVMYVFSAKFKSFADWVGEATSLHFALHAEEYATPLAHAVRDWLPLPWMSRASWWLELLGPLLLFCPFRTAQIRYLLAASFIGLHLGIEALMSVGLFSYVAVAAWTVVLPGGFWDRVESCLPRHRASPAGAPAAPAAGPGGWLAAAALVYVLAWNVWTLDVGGSWFPIEARWVGQQLKLHQLWIMFAPSPPDCSRWLEARATTRDGEQRLLYLDGRPMRSRPACVSQWVPERWRKCAYFVVFSKEADIAPRFARYLLREARSYDPSIASVRLVLCKRPSPPPGEPRAAPVTETVLACQDAEMPLAGR